MISQNLGLSVLALTVSIQPQLTQVVALSQPRAWCLMTLQCRAESTGSSLSERLSRTLTVPLLGWEPIHGQRHSILTTCSLNARPAMCTRVSFAKAQSRFAALPGSAHHRGLSTVCLSRSLSGTKREKQKSRAMKLYAGISSKMWTMSTSLSLTTGLKRTQCRVGLCPS